MKCLMDHDEVNILYVNFIYEDFIPKSLEFSDFSKWLLAYIIIFFSE